MRKTVPLLLDTDVGDDVDDAYAIVFAALHPALDLRAVTTVHGNTQHKARLAAKLLRMTGRTDVPVGAGPVHTPAQDCQAPFIRETDPEHRKQYPEALPLWRKTFAENAVALVTIGPTTNAGRYFAEPRSLPAPSCIATMAGEQRTRIPEYNVRSDPAAFRTMLAAARPLFQGAYTPTKKVMLSVSDVDNLRNSGLAHNQALAELTDLWWPHRADKTGPVLYDVCPLVWLFAPERFQTHWAHVAVETEDGPSLGRTYELSGPPNAEVCDDLDAEAIRTIVLETLLGTPKA
ncbi:MAG: nucleoside hydrolase [Planctomycetota bacterium]